MFKGSKTHPEEEGTSTKNTLARLDDLDKERQYQRLILERLPQDLFPWLWIALEALSYNY